MYNLIYSFISNSKAGGLSAAYGSVNSKWYPNSCENLDSFDLYISICLSVDDDDADPNKSYASGYGFAAFAHILGFIICCACSIYLSPLLTGTVAEKKMLQTPYEMGGESQSASAPVATAHAEPLYSGYPEPQTALNNKI